MMKHLFIPFVLATAPALLSSDAAAQSSGDLVMPSSMQITDLDGNELLAAPLRVYGEFQYGAARSSADLADSVDYHAHRFVIGADFVSPNMIFWGLGVGLSGARDDGGDPFGTVMETSKEALLLDLYVSRPVAPNIVVGSGFYYQAGRGETVYNRADVNNETSHGFGVAPFVAITHPLSDRASLEFRPTLAFRKSDFTYDLNVPSSASISSTTLSLPATLSYELTPELTVSGTASINQVLAEDTFPNVPSSSRTTLSLGVGVSYDFGNGYSLYGSLDTKLLDENYDFFGARIGLSYGF